MRLRSPIRTVIAAALTCVLAACGTRGRFAHPERLAGCYALFDGSGRPAANPPYFAPPRVKLDTTRHVPRGAKKLPQWSLTRLDSAGTPVTERPSEARYPYWAPTAGPDSVRLVFFNGVVGTEMDFAVPRARTDTLHGHAILIQDMVGAPATDSPVTAVRLACAAAEQPASPPR